VSKIPLKPLAVSPRDAGILAGISRARVYELIAAGELSAYKDGARTLILVADIETRLDRLKHWHESSGPLLPPDDQARAQALAESKAPPRKRGRPRKTGGDIAI
jgi:hypothetical protein